TMQQGIHQCALIARIWSFTGRLSCPCMNHHSGRLVDDGQGFVLIDHVQRNVFWSGRYWRWLGRPEDHNLFISAYAVRGSLRSSVHLDLFRRDQLLHARTADIGDRSREEAIQSLPCMLRGRAVTFHRNEIIEKTSQRHVSTHSIANSCLTTCRKEM